MSLAIIRAPFTYRFSDLEVFEEPIITYLAGYLSAVSQIDYKVYDFHLDRSLTLQSILDHDHDVFVIAVRETVENVHYVQRIAYIIRESTSAPIYIYGQVGRLDRLKWPDRAHLVIHDESELATVLGLPADGPAHRGGLRVRPYVHLPNLSSRQIRRFKAGLETSRGCHFPCKFCFINSGRNYQVPWAIRSNDDILSDLQTYENLGIRNVLFYDSEFLGGNARDYPRRLDLIQRFAAEAPKLNYKIYCRADTLERFNQYDALKSSGLAQVFIGVESLYQPDLDALGKRLNVGTIYAVIDELIRRDIFVTLSFITFNRNTDIESLSQNITALRSLYSRHSSRTRFLGMPNFVFGLESAWQEAPDRRGASLSDFTYVKSDLLQKAQPQGSYSVFDAKLEPLIEIYRLLAYEWSKKVVELSKFRESATASEVSSIESWFTALPEFCLLVMDRFLTQFRCGRLTFATLARYRDELFSGIELFYSALPARRQSLATFADHASHLTYSAPVSLLEQSEYWCENISPRHEAKVDY